MAVQKSKKSRSRSGMRRAHSAMENPALSTDSVSGVVHRRHHLTADGYYRGRQVLENNSVKAKD